MNKKYLIIGIAVLVLIGLVVASQIMNAPSAMTVNGQRNKDRDGSSSSSSFSQYNSSSTYSSWASSTDMSSSEGSSSSSSCMYECCSNADCPSADGQTVCGAGNVCTTNCNTSPAAATACANSGGRCNDGGVCEPPCGSGYCPLGTACAGVSCAPLPPPVTPPAEDNE